jgi:endonuclease/exonuclease/phosphatase family metal-dependent hydrolase
MRKYALVTLCMLSFNFMAATNTFDVMSYNVRRKGDDPQEHQWSNRKELISKQILTKKPTIIGFQEVVQGEQFDDLNKALSHYKSFGEPRSKNAGILQWFVMKHPKAKNECNPIFYNSEKVTLIESGTFGINPVKNLFTAWLPRVCTWGLFEDKKTKEQFYVYNTHLDKDSEKIQRKQLEIILNHRKKGKHNQSAPVIIMGDFNTKIEGDIKKIISDAGFAHAKEKAKVTKGPDATRTGWNDSALKEIDHILVKNADVTEYEVVESPQGVYPSDHRPVTAKIGLL